MTLWQTSLAFSFFLGIIAVATAPAATLMVIREYEADGPVTGVVLTLVGFNNLIWVLPFWPIPLFSQTSLWLFC